MVPQLEPDEGSDMAVAIVICVVVLGIVAVCAICAFGILPHFTAK